MPVRYLFVGERPSPTAFRRGFTWAHGRLAAKQLFDALRAAGVDPAACRFDNVFVPDPSGPERRCPNAARRVRRAHRDGLTVVAMGRKAAAVLAGWGVTHLTIVHPAARGRIRKKERYAAHVRTALSL